MTGGDYFHYGDSVNVSGSGNVGKIQNQYQGPQDSQAAFQDMIRAVQILRGQVSTEDREVIDASLEIIRQGDSAGPGALRRALGSIAGAAAVVGEIGLPVVEAVRRVLALLGG